MRLLEASVRLEWLELGAGARAPHVTSAEQDPVLGHRLADLSLESDAQVAQLHGERTNSRGTLVWVG